MATQNLQPDPVSFANVSENSAFTAIQNIKTSQLADTELFNFTDLTLNREGERKPYAFEDELSDQQHQADLENLWIDNDDIETADETPAMEESNDSSIQVVNIVNA